MTANCSFTACPAASYASGTPASHGDLCEVMRNRADRNCDGEVDDTDGDGMPDFRAQIPVVHYDGESEEACDAGQQYNQSATIVGWATVAIVSARCESTTKLPLYPQPGSKPITRICDEFTLAHGGYSASTCVAIQLYCDQIDPGATRVGCGWFGTIPIQPVLVR